MSPACATGKHAMLRDVRPVSMVSLDGGGVRGLSSLLILQSLLELVTEELINTGVLRHGHATVRPQDVFDIATGTSTGGLIVLMMVKLDMSLADCIQQYKDLSEQVFSKSRSLLKRVFGSDWSKYSGKRLQKAVEDLLESKNESVTLMMRSGFRRNSMTGTVLCHEVQEPHSVFFCTQECRGPYQAHMLQYDIELRHAARATSAAPSYFKEMRIQERIFVDGGFGETNNPSWEAQVHYHQNHDLTTDRQVVMINIGTGSVPSHANVVQLQERPWWTRLMPNGLLKALGLVADLVKMATESEKPAERLRYISDDHPEQLFFKRFSADTGIHDIQLDDWRAVVGSNGAGIIETRTRTYLNNTAVRIEMKGAARKLAEVYAKRHEQAQAPQVNTSESSQVIDLSISVVLDGAELGRIDDRGRLNALGPECVAETVPSLVTGSQTTYSPVPSPPRTPEPGRVPLSPTLATETKEVLSGQGQQFAAKLETRRPLVVDTSSERSPSPRARRAATLPASSMSSFGAR